MFTGAKRREWIGCWGLLGRLLIVSQWIIPENSLRLAQVSMFIIDITSTAVTIAYVKVGDVRNRILWSYNDL